MQSACCVSLNAQGPISLPRYKSCLLPSCKMARRPCAQQAVKPERGLRQRSDSNASAAFCGRHSLVPFARSSTGLFVGHGHAAGVPHGHFSRPRWKHLAQGTVCAVERPVEDKEPALGCRNGQIGQGKSPAMEPLLQAMKRALSRNPSFAVGVASDGFHYQRASAAASAVLKLRQCSGYLSFFNDESEICLSSALASGSRRTAKHVDLPLFLNSAHRARSAL